MCIYFCLSFYILYVSVCRCMCVVVRPGANGSGKQSECTASLTSAFMRRPCFSLPGRFKVPHKLYSRCLFPSQNAGTSFTSRDDGQLLECERVPAADTTEGGTYGHARNEWQLSPPVKIVCCLCVCVCPLTKTCCR